MYLCVYIYIYMSYVISKVSTFNIHKTNRLSKKFYLSIMIIFNAKIQIIEMEILQYSL